MKIIRIVPKSPFYLLFLSLFSILLFSCDGTPDPLNSGATSTFEYLYVSSPNSHLSGNSNIWTISKESTAGAGFASPIVLRNENLAPSLFPNLFNVQCSAYDKVNKRYVVSSGDRLLLYDVSTNTPPAPTIYPNTNAQAIEFVNGRFFMVQNYILSEYDISGNRVSSFPSYTLASTGKISNLTTDGTYLYIISSNLLYKIDVNVSQNASGAVSFLPGYPKSVATADYHGLEFINSTGCPNSLYVMKVTTSSGINQESFVKIDPSTGNETVRIANLGTPSIFRFSSALDYQTEFYYLDASNGITSNQHTLYSIDLTPTSGTYSASTVTSPNNGYLFGLQLKD